MMRVLAIDYGERRIGVAVSDAAGIIASPSAVVPCRADGSHLDEIARQCVELGVGCVVVGLPLRMSGEEGPSARAARTFAHDLQLRLLIPVELFDERLTTSQAQRSLLESNMPRAKRRRVVDAVSAAVLLEAYLRRRKEGIA